MKKIFIIIFLSLHVCGAFAAHIKGGFINYKYLGPGIRDTSNLRYKLTLTVYMLCDPLHPLSAGQLTNPINLTVFKGSSAVQFDNPSVSITNQYTLGKAIDEPCITGNQAECYYTIVVYELNNYELPVTAEGFTISYQRCCRIAGMDNIENSGDVGNTYSIKIPGTSSAVPDANKNSSPNFLVNDTAVVCGGNFFSFNLGATDPDGDSLVYVLCAAYSGGGPQLTPADCAVCSSPNPAQPPPYGSVPYPAAFSGSQPMGADVTINSRTGLLSGIAPMIISTGEYVVTVCVFEYRKGVFLAQSRKELHIKVKDCVPLVAQLDPKPVTCDGFTVSFSNAVPLQSGTFYEWNFGDTASGLNNISTIETPSHTYVDTGVYTVKLRVFQSGGLCADSTTTIVKVYPGFFPAFTITPPFCKGVPIQFVDQTTSRYGVPTGWHWDFGNTNAINDTSIVQNPTYVYPSAGTYKVKLIVGNTFGCVDSVFKNVTILDKPPLSVFPKDSTYCGLDTIQLSATGSGNFTWTPATNIIGTNTSNPSVFPSVPTKYYVTMVDNGCTNTDSLKVSPVNNFTVAINASATTICQADTLVLTGSSNYTNNVSWQWSPAAFVATPTQKITKAFPPSTTIFTLSGKWGKHCSANDTKTITVIPLAVPDAGPATYVCKGQGTAQLQASGGATYQWTPATGLNNSSIANPVASPSVTTLYKVSVGVAGCSATRSDTVTVVVRDLPDAKLTDDTLICSIDTLQLKTSATANFVWSPNYMISSLTSSSPLVSPDVPTTYYTTLTDRYGCINKDSIFVDVKLFVTISAGKDTTICRSDAFQLNTVSDALSYKWSPATYLNSDTAKRPIATPAVPFITYYVIGNIGKCQSRDTINIKTVPYPVAVVGPGPKICYGDSAQLLASGGSIYHWTPATFLNDVNIPNPMAIKPTIETLYTVAVSDTFGCPKPVTATVLLSVRPIVIARTGLGKDTSIVIGQSLQMNASGGDSYLWSPATWLSDIHSPRAIASPQQDITYQLTVTQLPENCKGYDSVRIKVFLLPPSFYVPTAFSPNGDGINDDLKPRALGMKSIRYFRVYNRLGQLVFQTNQIGKGWDGTYKGNPQDPATFVWMAQGETWKGELITRKGSAVLIR